jgi:hypothetical protein
MADTDAYVGVDPRVRELEQIFEAVLLFNNKYGGTLDMHIQPQTVASIQDLEDFLGAWYNNFNVSAPASPAATLESICSSLTCSNQQNILQEAIILLEDSDPRWMSSK